MKKYRRKKKINHSDAWRYKTVLIMLGAVVIVILLSLSFNQKYLYVTKAINSIFYYPFKNLTNEEDIIGMNINEELKEEITSLKKVANIDKVLTDFEIINGVVISRNISYWTDEIVINIGSSDGVEEKMAVVISEGLVGFVSEVYPHSSRVTLVTNNSYNNTSVRVNKMYLVLEYDNDNNLIINQLDNSNSIKVGDIVYTSGLTDKYPAGLTIGYISKIEDNSYNSGKKLYVQLYYDINSLRYVSVLKR